MFFKERKTFIWTFSILSFCIIFPKIWRSNLSRNTTNFEKERLLFMQISHTNVLFYCHTMYVNYSSNEIRLASKKLLTIQMFSLKLRFEILNLQNRVTKLSYTKWLHAFELLMGRLNTHIRVSNSKLKNEKNTFELLTQKLL